MKPTANTKEVEKLENKMIKVARQIPNIITATINTQAFDMKNLHIPNAMDHFFTIRAPKFIKRQTRVNLAKKGKDPSNNRSEVGTVETDRFTALGEQQEGKAPEKKRTATIDTARGGSFAKKQRPSTRLKPGTFRRQSEFAGRSKKHRIFQMIRETKAHKLNFVINGGEGNSMNLPDGLYGWKGKNLKMLQSFDPPKPHRANWMGFAIKLLKKNRGSFDRVFQRKLDAAVRRADRG